MKYLFSLAILAIVVSANARAEEVNVTNEPVVVQQQQADWRHPHRRGYWHCQFRDVFRRGYNGYARWQQRAYDEARYLCETRSPVPRTCSLNRCSRE